MDITTTGTNAYHALISRVDSETLTYRWEFDGLYDQNTDRLNYTVCTKKEIVKASDGSETTAIDYEDGSGYMQILSSSGSMFWTDNKENVGAGREFKKL